MPIPDKLSELQQRRTKLHDEARELCERIEKENREMTKDEDARYIQLCGTEKDQGGEIFGLDKQISQLRRLQALDRNGDDPRNGKDPDTEFRNGRQSDPLPHEDPTNTGNGKHRYSLLRAVHACATQGVTFGGLEKEVSDELIKRTGKDAHSFMMPYRNPGSARTPLTFAEIDRQRRAMEMRVGVLDSNTGAGSVPTILDADWIELLRNQMMVMQAGAREILDLQGKFAIPRQSQAATAYWLAESGSPTGSNQTLDQVLFTPHTIGAFTDISRRFFELTILDSGEEFVKSDLTAVLARGVDLAALNGSGNAGQPLGIMQNTGITGTRTMSLGTNGGVPTWAAMVELQTIVSRGNASALGEFVYMGNADVKGTLATTAKIGSTFPVYLLADDGKIYSTRAVWTQQLPNNFTKGSSGATLSPLIGGIWNQLILAYWSGIDILVDPYTGSSSGTIRIVALQDMDIQVRHNEAFSFIVDMITNQSA